eukprot:SAG31_NODE_72_length_27821_cov_26.870572_2_plen_785_part_00
MNDGQARGGRADAQRVCTIACSRVPLDCRVFPRAFEYVERVQGGTSAGRWKSTTVDPAPAMNHIVLAIDNSRSMETADVDGENFSCGSKMRRCDAVRCYAQRLLGDVLAAGSGSALLSVICFDDRARSEVQAAPLTRELAARAMTFAGQPRRGTNFSECWQIVEKVVEAAGSGTTAHHVIFFTDGMPGELSGGKKPLPRIGTEFNTSRYDKMERPSAPAIVRRLAQNHKSNLAIYAVGFGTDDFRWPRRLADIATAEGAHGEFILSTTANTAAPNFTEALGTRKALAVATYSVPPQIKRPNAMPKFGRAVASVRGLAGRGDESAASGSKPSPAAHRLLPSLKGAFESITSSITSSMSMSTSDAQKHRKLRPYVPEHKDAWKQKEGWKTLVAHRLEVDLNTSGERYERWLQCNVSIRAAPFARGGQQNAYHMKVGELHCVAKESRWEGAVGDADQRLRALKLAIEETNVARKLAQEFNQALAVKVKGDQDFVGHEAISISVVPVSIYRILLRIGEEPRYMSVERFLEGRFLKANGNNGYISAAGKFALHRKALTKSNAIQILPHAFTHWSFEHTAVNPETTMMVCDIQGVKLEYTDVNIHSRGRKFGSTDLGEDGMDRFFKTHTCNAACRLLGLMEHTAEEDCASGKTTPATASTATEKIELIRSRHLQSRKRERGVDTIEIQRAIKHGRKEQGNAGTGRIKHTHNGVSVVTDASCKTGVTTYRNSRQKGVANGRDRSQIDMDLAQLALPQRHPAPLIPMPIPIYDARARAWAHPDAHADAPERK